VRLQRLTLFGANRETDWQRDVHVLTGGLASRQTSGQVPTMLP
jgi:hypothetical protein